MSIDEDGLYSLTDLWRQSKREIKNRPNDWLRTKPAEALMRAIATRSDHIVTLYTSHHGVGTYAAPEIAMAYAQFLGLLDVAPTVPAPAPVVLPSKFTIGDKLVATNAGGLVSLTDLWKAGGGKANQKPSDWRRKEGSNFITHLSTAESMPEKHLFLVTMGRNGGTFAHWQIALAYAKYLSPELHMAVNEIFMRYQTGDPTLAEEVIDKVEDPAALERIEKRARAKKQYKRLASVVFAKGGELSGSI